MAMVMLLDNIGFAWANYISYSKYNLLPPSSNPVDLSFYLWGIVRNLVWSIFIAIGLYIYKIRR